MSYKILIVDDDVLLRRSLAFNLEQSGMITNTAESAEDAIAMIQIDKPDIILLDIGLPGMDGMDAMIGKRKFKALKVKYRNSTDNLNQSKKNTKVSTISNMQSKPLMRIMA